MITTLEMGPRLHVQTPDFRTHNHEGHELGLADLLGERGLVLAFTGDIWEPASVRRILWLQRHEARFTRLGVRLALLICNEPPVLNSFVLSSAEPLSFPLLSDTNRTIHKLYNLNHRAGVVVIDAKRVTRDKWIVPDERVWPKAPELLSALEKL